MKISINDEMRCHKCIKLIHLPKTFILSAMNNWLWMVNEPLQFRCCKIVFLLIQKQLSGWALNNFIEKNPGSIIHETIATGINVS